MSKQRMRRRVIGVAVTLMVVPAIVASSSVASSSVRATPPVPRVVRQGRMDKTVWDSVYSAAQAGRGETAYAKACARCHGATLSGGDEAPALSGGAFLGNWNGVSLGDLHERIRTTMPSDSVGIYSKALVSDVIAYLLKANGFPAGGGELAPDAQPLKEIVVRTSRP